MTMEAGDDALFLGIDCSTTACKAIAWDREGRAVAEGRAPIPLSNPAPDAWEQDARTWWEALALATREAAQALGDRGAQRIRAITITHQRETFVLTDEHGEPLHPALVWMDARCRAEVAALAAKVGEARLHEISGKFPCTTPSLYKLLHLRNRIAPHLASRPVRMLDVHAFLAHRLTGRLVTSVASADPTGLVDMAARGFSADILAWAGLSASEVPALAEPGERIGEVSGAVAADLGIEAGIPVFAGAGDGQAAALGAGVVGPGVMYLNLGTAIVSGVISREYRTDRAFRTMMAATPGAFLYETDLKGGTFTLTWLARLLGADADAASSTLAALEREAEGLPPGADGLVLVPYFHGVMNPYWDDAATGLLLGFSGGQGPAHLYRAILEGIALEQRLHTDGVERASGPITELRVMGGGSRSALWCQILADVLDKPIVRAGTSEATSLGAGILAAAGVGAFAGIEEAAAAMTSRGEVFVPGERRAVYERLYREVYVGLYPALSGAMGRLAQIRESAR
ncbi:xylulokinase [Polyangium sorediatum]|uniref:FGGY family carbohydrate kinase n=1 Tax=Polyangium sorediatum TaxID=889274 RepID=A0ABT6P078_9BACT|nr:FGGY family carbohydrate kinase [Polyangium sorediatum]MDI1434007.1 FGGY family carbohydrate kinase [Polyangium sorediatum]